MPYETLKTWQLPPIRLGHTEDFKKGRDKLIIELWILKLRGKSLLADEII